MNPRPRVSPRFRSVGWPLATLLLVVVSSLPAWPAHANGTGNVLVGGFEIDGNYYPGFDNQSSAGNPIDPRGIDWGSPQVEAAAAHLVDGIGHADDTVLTGGVHEDHPLDQWHNTVGGAPGAGDIHNVWAFSQVVGGDVYGYFAWDRFATAGQVTWYLELNQRANTVNVNGVSVPNRSAGDLRITLHRVGHDLTVVATDQWRGPNDADWRPFETTELAGLTNDSPITTPDGPLDAQLFLEFGFNISALFGTDSCGAARYSAVNLRSTAGGVGAELKDYLTVPVGIESRCGELIIEKNDENGVPIGGATFTVSPNPLPGAPAEPPLTVTDNGPVDLDGRPGLIRFGAVEPDTYTILEAQAPPGYLADPQPWSGTVEPGGSRVVAFTNGLGSITWTKLDADTGSPVCCATFTVVGTGGAASTDPWNVDLTVTDQQAGRDIEPAIGRITVGDLPTGTYTVTETVPPAGYLLPATTTVSGVVISADTPDPTIAQAFADPQIRTDLSLLKVDATSREPLDGAVFRLYLDDGDGVGDAPDEGDVPVGPDCTTGDDGAGLCTVTGLVFGDYYWYEVAAPPGYVLPADRTSPLITVGAGNAGRPSTYTFTNPRLPGTLRVVKLDEIDGSPLAGAEFELYLDDGSGAYDAADTLIGSCTTNATGTCEIEDLDFGTYFWVETSPPTGYALRERPVSDPVVINADNVGEVGVSRFSDPRLPSRLVVTKLDASTGAPVAGGRFDLVRDDGNGVYEPGTDAVVGSCITGGDGTCSVEGIGFGTYFWVETAPPIGYHPPDNPVSDPITIDTDNAGTELAAVSFADAQVLSELTVAKVDATSGAPLADGHFGLLLDVDGDGDGDGDTGTRDPEDLAIGTCTTRDTGTCTIGDLAFGSYYWMELSAPAGYRVPPDRTSPLITITADVAGTDLATFTFHDPRILSRLTVAKQDAVTAAPLAGARFDLVRDDGDGVYRAGADPVTGSCTTGETGTCTVADVDFGTYFWVETTPPDGYGLPDNPVSEPITIGTGNAGTDFDTVVFSDPRLPVTPPGPPPTAPPAGGGLAVTGARITALLAAGLALIVLGAGFVLGPGPARRGERAR